MGAAVGMDASSSTGTEPGAGTGGRARRVVAITRVFKTGGTYTLAAGSGGAGEGVNTTTTTAHGPGSGGAGAGVVRVVAVRVYPTRCNGQDICRRALNTATFAAAHNSYATLDDGGLAAHSFTAMGDVGVLSVYHFISLPAQWTRGFRGFEVDLVAFQGRLMLCPGPKRCLLGAMDARLWFRKLFELVATTPMHVAALEINPGEVSLEVAHAALASTGLLGIAWTPAPGDRGPGLAWPSFEDMVVAGKRLHILWKGAGLPNATAHPWALPFTALSGNALQSPDPALPGAMVSGMEFACVRPGYAASGGGGEGQGEGRGAVYDFSAYETGRFAMADVGAATRINDLSTLYGHANDCWRKASKRPNLITVDFAGTGSAVEVAALLNTQDTWSDLPLGAQVGAQSGGSDTNTTANPNPVVCAATDGGGGTDTLVVPFIAVLVVAACAAVLLAYFYSKYTVIRAKLEANDALIQELAALDKQDHDELGKAAGGHRPSDYGTAFTRQHHHSISVYAS